MEYSLDLSTRQQLNVFLEKKIITVREMPHSPPLRLPPAMPVASHHLVRRQTLYKRADGST